MATESATEEHQEQEDTDPILGVVPEMLHDRAVFAAALLYGAYSSLAFPSLDEAQLQEAILQQVKEFIPDIEERLATLLNVMENGETA
jgi:hypothetical protein